MKIRRNILATGLVSALVMAGAGVALGQVVFTFDIDNMGWGPNEYTPSGRYGAAASWGSTAGVSGGGLQITCNIDVATKAWWAASEYQKPSGPINALGSAALEFDFRIDPASQVTSADALRVFTQCTPTMAWNDTWVWKDGTAGNIAGPAINDTAWHHAVVPANLLGGSMWNEINLIGIGPSWTYYSGGNAPTGNFILDIDNVGFTAVPEPSCGLLTGLGAVSFGLINCYRRSRRS